METIVGNLDLYLNRDLETITQGTWQTWNPLIQGKWWGTNSPISDECSITEPCTWNELLSEFPNIGIKVKILLKVGSGWNSFDGNVDAFTIGVNGNNVTYNFEP